MERTISHNGLLFTEDEIGDLIYQSRKAAQVANYRSQFTVEAVFNAVANEAADALAAYKQEVLEDK
jgi:hypothetical protein